MEDLIEKLNKAPIDWCFNCASIGMKNVKKLMFTYIFLQYVRMIPKKSYGFFSSGMDDNKSITFMFKPGFLKEWDNVAINKDKKKKSNYEGLVRILREHIWDCGIQIPYKSRIDISQDDLSVQFF